MSSKIDKEEINEYECDIKILNKPAKFILTNKNIIIKKEKGLFFKKLKETDRISLDDIKISGDNVGIKQSHNQITIQSTQKNITFDCASSLEAIKIYEKLVGTKTGKSIAERGYLKFKNWQKTALGGLVTGTVVKKVWQNRDKIIDTIKMLFIKRK